MAGYLNCALRREVWLFWLRGRIKSARNLSVDLSLHTCNYLTSETVLGCWGMCEQEGTRRGSHLGAFSVEMCLCVGIQRSYLEEMYITYVPVVNPELKSN